MEVKSWYDEKLKSEGAAPAKVDDGFVDTRSSEYVLEQRKKMSEWNGMKLGFDFSGTPKFAPNKRNDETAGTNDQGYKAPPPPAEKGFPLALIPAVLLIGALTAYNQGMLG